MNIETSENHSTYDEVPYESHTYPQSHPDRLALIGRVFGMTPAPVSKCRVLEMGCSSGGNIMAMAAHLPDSEFVGVDFSKRQVEIGRQTIQAIGLKNMDLRQASISDIDASYGKFDYIIAHGVYSWVDNDIREKILEVSSANLAENGIAYISYNTYPGWRMREMVRDMMLYHIEQFPNPTQKIQQAKALLDFLVSSVPTENNPFGMYLKQELELIKRVKEWYLFHDHLEKVNDPIYFHQFMEKASRYDLQYLGESDFSTMLTNNFSPKVAETLNRINRNNIIHTEQYMDFLRNRTFRQTLLCHKGVAIKRNLVPDDVKNLLVASPLVPEKEPVDFSAEANLSFKNNAGQNLQTNSPIIKAMIIVLKKYWPRAISISELFKEVMQEFEKIPALKQAMANVDENAVAGEVLRLFANRSIELYTWQADFVTMPGDRPKAGDLAVHLAKQKTNSVPNLRHEMIGLSPASMFLLQFLDGTKNNDQLIEELRKLAESGQMEIKEKEERLTDSAKITLALEKFLEQELKNIARLALLER